jgi:hypothetical protein
MQPEAFLACRESGDTAQVTGTVSLGRKKAKEVVMEYDAQMRRLTLAEFDIAMGLERIRRQWETIITLERDGCDAKTAHQLLETLLETQAIQEENREIILSKMQ